MMSPVMLILYVPVVFGAGALLLGLFLAAATVGVCEAVETRPASGPPVTRPAFPRSEPSGVSLPRAA